MPKTQQREFHDFITLPVIPPTLVNVCKVIQVTYRLNFDIRVSGCHRNVEVAVPIVVGTIPILSEDDRVIQSQPSAPKLDEDEISSRFNWPFGNFNCWLWLIF